MNTVVTGFIDADLVVGQYGVADIAEVGAIVKPDTKRSITYDHITLCWSGGIEVTVDINASAVHIGNDVTIFEMERTVYSVSGQLNAVRKQVRAKYAPQVDDDGVAREKFHSGAFKFAIGIVSGNDTVVDEVYVGANRC